MKKYIIAALVIATMLLCSAGSAGPKTLVGVFVRTICAYLRVDNGSTGPGAIRLYEDSDNGSNYTGFAAPSSLSGDTSIDPTAIYYSGGTDVAVADGGTGSSTAAAATDALDAGYTLSVQALTSSPTDAQTVHFGQLPKAPTTTAGISKVYIPRTGTIKRAVVYCYSGTAGTNENWSLYIRLNNSTDTLIETIGASASERVFDNTSLSISVSAGDYIEIKGIQPTWATNPLTTIYGGYIWIE